MPNHYIAAQLSPISNNKQRTCIVFDEQKEISLAPSFEDYFTKLMLTERRSFLPIEVSL